MKFILIALLVLTACKDDVPPPKDTTSLTTTAPSEKGPVVAVPVVPSPAPEVETFEKRFQTLINNHRIDIGIDVLTFSSAINDIAKKHSENMAKGIVSFGHSGFSARCTQGKTAIGGGNLCAENVAMGQKTPEAAFESWMNSSGHKANIEQSRITHTGFGFAKSSSGTLYWTQIFIEKN